MNSHPHETSKAIVSQTLRVIAITSILATSALAASHKAPPVKPANQYTAFDAHPNEHVTIAIDPCNDPDQCSFFRLPYIQHGFIPVRVIITNDGDTALTLNDVRIQFISAANDKLPAADLDEINRRLFTIKNSMGTHLPFPVPITVHKQPVDKKITQDDADFGFQGTTVNAHSTLGGYLFYDVRGLDDPPLKGAQIYVKMIHTLDGKHELFPFTIPFDKWLAANSPATKSTSQKK
ncbi:hypothetical protein P8936_03450 [Edaphobacter paludis]|uniref:Uncharacterized protein n=1 Tax=Edaphobacter paludis TaxID=3035702 RepID=A0AAU7D9B6_9BACT